MTANRNLRRRIRGRAARTGESYTAARQHIMNVPGSGTRQRMIKYRPSGRRAGRLGSRGLARPGP